MNRCTKRLIAGITGFLLTVACHKAKDDKKPEPAITSLVAAELMGRGFNLGNTFDAYGQVWQKHDIGHTKRIIDLYKQQGIQNIRIPITWMQEHEDGTLADAEGHINTNHPRFKDLVATIDYALSQGLYVVINTHHEHWLKQNYDSSEAMDKAFRTLWTEIASYFRDYPQRLMFEVLNEPDGVFGDWSKTKNIGPKEASGIALTRKINQLGYDAIRATGGANQSRIIILAPNGQGNHGQINDIYPEAQVLPGGGNDPYVMITGHSYDPWDFCGNTGFNKFYLSDKGEASLDRLHKDVSNLVQNASAWSKKMGVGLYFGEYGVGREIAQNERNTLLVREYYRSFTQALIDAKIATAVWDDKGWFGILNAKEGDDFQFIFGLIDAIMGKAEPAPAP